MDKYDSNQWTKEFVLNNKAFCIDLIKDTNDQVIEYLKQGEHKAVIVGLDRILNGLVTMINAGYDYRSEVCFFSWILGNVILFGNLPDASEQNRINTAKGNLLDARDYAKSETAKNEISAIIDDINSGCTLAMLASKYKDDFPRFEIESLTNLNNKLDRPVVPVAPASSASSRKRPWWLIVVIIIIALIVIANLLTAKQDKEKAPIRESATQTTQTTTQHTTSEITTEATTVTTTEPTTVSPSNSLVGKWVCTEINDGVVTPDGEVYPDHLAQYDYSFDNNGRYSSGSLEYAETSESNSPNVYYINGRYWECVGGDGRDGSYTIDGNTITLVSDASVQYGESTTRTISFTLDGDTLILEHSYGTRVYKRVVE